MSLISQTNRDSKQQVDSAPQKGMRVGIIGLGTVGTGVLQVLLRNQQEIQRRAGCAIEVVAVYRRDAAAALQTLMQTESSAKLVASAQEIIDNPEIDIVVELMGGTGEAKSLVLAAIEAGKHVVSANKALIAQHGTEIFAKAQSKGVVVAFEAAVAGGIPIIKAVREGLAANQIQMVAGIINGTTNFILSEMREKGLDFATVLAQAQKLGYAEADPTFDIEGIDAAHKISILSALSFGTQVQFEKAYVEGITKLSNVDIRYAEQLGYRIKLLGISKFSPAGLELRVHPCLIPSKRLIANVEGAMNAVLVQTDALGPTMYYGKGAGGEPTASAVIADLVDVARVHSAAPQHRVPPLAFQPESLSSHSVLPMSEVVTSYYLRLRVADEPGVLAQLARILADNGISIDAVLQRQAGEVDSQAQQTDLIILTHDTKEGKMNAALAAAQSLDSVLMPIVTIRKEELA